MKAVLIFKGGACSLLFYQRDPAFAEYLHSNPQYKVAVSKLGMNEEDFATGLLKPLLASCLSMQHLFKNAYQHLQSGRMSLVCCYYQSLTFVAVNGDGQETVDFMRRKLAALHALLRMSLGPVIETISENRPAAQQKFASLFGTWCCLVSNEQCFLIEAIEKLYINQASESLSKKCVEALEDVVAKWNSSIGAVDAAKPLLRVDHAALFARDKLLALYSKSVEGKDRQILLQHLSAPTPLQQCYWASHRCHIGMNVKSGDAANVAYRYMEWISPMHELTCPSRIALSKHPPRRKKLSPYDLLLSIVYMLEGFPPSDWSEPETATHPSPNNPNSAGPQRPVSAYSVSSNENYETSDDLTYSDREDTVSACAFSEVDKISGDSTTVDCFVSPSSTPSQSPVGPVDKQALPTALLSSREAAPRSPIVEQEATFMSALLGSPAIGQELGDTDRSCVGSDRPDPDRSGLGDSCAAAASGAAVATAAAAAESKPVNSFSEAIATCNSGEESGPTASVTRECEQSPPHVHSNSGTCEPLHSNCPAQSLAISGRQLEAVHSLSSISSEAGSNTSSVVPCGGDDIAGRNNAHEGSSGRGDEANDSGAALGLEGVSHVVHLPEGSASTGKMSHSFSNDGGDKELGAGETAGGSDLTFAELSTDQQAADSVSSLLNGGPSRITAHLEQSSDADGPTVADRSSSSNMTAFPRSKHESLDALVGNIALMVDQALAQAGDQGPADSSAMASGVTGDTMAPTIQDTANYDRLWGHPTIDVASSFRKLSMAGQPQTFIVERVFVKQDGYYVPKDMYIISVLPGINLVLFSEDLPPRSRMARNLQVAMGTLGALLDPASRMRLALVQQCLQSIGDEVETIIKGLRDVSCPAGAGRCSADLAERWQSVAGGPASRHRRELVDCLGSCLALGRPLPDNVEQGLADTLADLCRIFVLLYCSTAPAGLAEAATSLVESARSFLRAEIGDFADFFVARAQRNFTMAQFQSPPFEGLFHFVFVNRTSNYVAAPSLLPDASDGGGNDSSVGGWNRRTAVAKLNLFIKHRLWSNVEWIYSQLQRAACVTSLVWDADFVFSYMLWFEDSTGTPRPVPPQPELVHMPPPIGDFDGRFYRTLTHKLFKDEDVQCCEMFGVHLGMLPESVIIKQCQRLYHYVWHYIPLETEPI